LTTVRLPLEDMGVRAGELALELETPAKDRLVRVRGEVVIRESTRRVGA
jgi:LacI family transcriptional regulator